MENVVKRTFERGRRAIRLFSEQKCTTIAGTLVFFLIMSLVPFLFWLVLLFGQTGLSTVDIFNLELFEWAKDLLVFFQNNVESATTGVSVFFLATTLFSSTSFFYHLRRSGEIIYRYRRLKNGFKVRLSAAIFTLFLLLFFAAAGAVLIGTNYFAGSLPKWLYYLTIYSLVLTFGFFASWLLNTYICPYRAALSDTVTGSLFTAVAWLIAAIAFTFYMRFANPERLYGALALFIAFLIFLYWMMIVFTAGAILNCRRMQVKNLEHKKL